MMRRSIFTLFMFVFIAGIGISTAHAAPIPCGTTLTAANIDGQTVELAANCTYNFTTRIQITQPTTITGGTNTRLMAGSDIFQVNGSASLTLTNLILSGSSSLQAVTTSGNLTVNNSRFEANPRGAVAVYGGTAVFNNTSFDGNSYSFGGAIYLDAGSVTINGGTFSNNTAIFGSAIYASSLTRLTTRGTVFTNNGGGGGSNSAAITVNGATAVDVRGSQFINNPQGAINTNVTADATCSWWGNASGPGSGAVIGIGLVTVSPWAKSIADIGTCLGENPGPTPDPSILPGGVVCDDRVNCGFGDLYAAVYYNETKDGLNVYCINAGSGYFAMQVTQAEFDRIGTPDANTEVEASPVCNVAAYVLSDGAYQINIGPDAEGKVYELIFDGLANVRNANKNEWNMWDIAD